MVALQQVAVGLRVELGALPSTTTGTECTDSRFVREGELDPGQIAWPTTMGWTSQRTFVEIREKFRTILLASLTPGDSAKQDTKTYSIASPR
jgi:hypothetical protein